MAGRRGGVYARTVSQVFQQTGSLSGVAASVAPRDFSHPTCVELAASSAGVGPVQLEWFWGDALACLRRCVRDRYPVHFLHTSVLAANFEEVNSGWEHYAGEAVVVLELGADRCGHIPRIMSLSHILSGQPFFVTRSQLDPKCVLVRPRVVVVVAPCCAETFFPAHRYGVFGELLATRLLQVHVSFLQADCLVDATRRCLGGHGPCSPPVTLVAARLPGRKRERSVSPVRSAVLARITPQFGDGVYDPLDVPYDPMVGTSVEPLPKRVCY